MKTRNIETIYAALFTLLDQLRIEGTLINASRRLQHVNDYDVSNMPAGFQNQTGVAVTPVRSGPLPKNRFTADWYIYVPGGEADNDINSSPLNAILDAAIAKLAPPANSTLQTLGGLVENCYVEGTIEMYEGVLQDRSVAIIPITIVAPGF